MIGFWAAVIALIVWAVGQFRPAGGGERPGSSSALRILEERFARGEIDRAEFEERRSALEGR